MSDLHAIITTINYQTLPDGTRIPVSGIQTRSFVTPVPQRHLDPLLQVPGQQIYPPTLSSTSRYTYSTPHHQAQSPRVLSQDNPAPRGVATSGQPPPEGWRPSSTYQSRPHSRYQPFANHRPVVQPQSQYTPLTDRRMQAQPQTPSAYDRRGHSRPQNQYSPPHHSQPPFTIPGQSYQSPPPSQPFTPSHMRNQIFNQPPPHTRDVLDDTRYSVDAAFNAAETTPHASTSAVPPRVQPEVHKKKKYKKRRYSSRKKD